jgi:PAS domain S-box-containing protein
VRYCNQRLIDYTGLSEEELQLGSYAALHPEDVERVKAAWQVARAQGTDYEMQQRVRGRDGGYRRFVCRAVVVKDEQGRPGEWFGTDTDVEDFQRAQEALGEAQFELARMMRVSTMGELAASIAHEVKQPLAAISINANACARWLSARPPNLRQAKRTTEHIVRDTNRAADIITRILTFLKREPTQRGPVDVNEVIADVVAMVRVEIRVNEISLVLPQIEPLSVQADRVQLQQVILNLMMNAIDAMRPVMRRARTVQISTGRHSSELLRVSVSDTGVGLAPEQRERIFDAFHTTKPNGMGMGLAISRSIVEAHGGQLWATRNEGPGATFHLTLPVAIATNR